MLLKFAYLEDSDKKKRLDIFLTEVSGFSRSKILKHIKEGKVQLNTKIVTKPAEVLKIGDEILITPVEEAIETLKIQEKKLDIIYEDDYLLAINKGPNVVVHPGAGNKENTLVNYVFGYLKKKPYLIHRLDKDTSGVILLAKDEDTHHKMQALWQRRDVTKTYETLVKGILDVKKGIIDSPIIRDKINRQKMKISAMDNARNAITHFKCITAFHKYTFLEVEILTGRTHQIRVHLSAINHPVIGDATYGDKSINEFFQTNYGLYRQFLHAKTLKFIHPILDKEIYLKSPLPKDLSDILSKLS